MKKYLIIFIIVFVFFLIPKDEIKYKEKIDLSIIGNVYDVSLDEFIDQKQVNIDGSKIVYPFKSENNIFYAMIDVEGITRDYKKYSWVDGFLKPDSLSPLNMLYSSYDINDSNIYYFASLYTDFDFENYILILYDEKTIHTISKNVHFEDLQNCTLITSYNNIEELKSAFENRYELLP